MNTTEARMFSHSEYGFEYHTILDFRYSDISMEEVKKRKDGLTYYEFNNRCIDIYASIKNSEYVNKTDSFEYVDNKLLFYKNNKLLDDNISNSIQKIINFSSQQKIYRKKYIIDDNLVVERCGTIGVNPNSGMEVVKDIMYTKKEFSDKYGFLPSKSFSFTEAMKNKTIL